MAYVVETQEVAHVLTRVWRGYVASTFSKKAAREETVVCVVIAILEVKEKLSIPSVSHALTNHRYVLGTASKSTTHVLPSSCIYSTHLLLSYMYMPPHNTPLQISMYMYIIVVDIHCCNLVTLVRPL